MIPYRIFKSKKILDRKKKDPGQFIFTGQAEKEILNIQLFNYNVDECHESNIQDDKLDFIDTFKDSNNNFWLNIHGLSNTTTIALICAKLQIHNLVVQDILDVNQRPKYVDLENYYFFTIKSIVPEGDMVFTEQISFILGKNYLVSFQEKPGDFFSHLRYQLRENIGILRSRGTDYLLFAMLEAILDNYFKTLQALEIDIEQLDPLDPRSGTSPKIVEQIELSKNHIHLIEKVIKPIRDFTLIIERGENHFIERRHQKYFLEIKDLCLTLLDHCETLDSNLNSKTNLFFSLQGHNLNQIMKVLTTVATIFIPLTFIAGIYGMNFEYMPELHWKYGYAATWAAMLLIFSGMVYYFKKNNWF